MRTVSKLSVGAALIGSVILSFSGVAQASDHWDRDHDRDRDRHHHYDHNWHGRDRIVERHVVERPVYVRERPVYAAPMFIAPPMYQQQQQGPSGVNLNFNIPLN